MKHDEMEVSQNTRVPQTHWLEYLNGLIYGLFVVRPFEEAPNSLGWDTLTAYLAGSI